VTQGDATKARRLALSELIVLLSNVVTHCDEYGNRKMDFVAMLMDIDPQSIYC